MSLNRSLAVAAALAVGATMCAVAPSAQAAIGCRPDSTSNQYFTVSVKRALLSCDVLEFGVRGGDALEPSGAEFSVWGPDNFVGLVKAQPGEYAVAWKGDHAAGAKWCASFVGDYAELCLTT
jgi:hypothetical protein